MQFIYILPTKRSYLVDQHAPLIYFKTNYEVSTPISLKTNNKKPNNVIVYLHICVFST